MKTETLDSLLKLLMQKRMLNAGGFSPQAYRAIYKMLSVFLGSDRAAWWLVTVFPQKILRLECVRR